MLGAGVHGGGRPGAPQTPPYTLQEVLPSAGRRRLSPALRAVRWGRGKRTWQTLRRCPGATRERTPKGPEPQHSRDVRRPRRADRVSGRRVGAGGPGEAPVGLQGGRWELARGPGRTGSGPAQGDAIPVTPPTQRQRVTMDGGPLPGDAARNPGRSLSARLASPKLGEWKVPPRHGVSTLMPAHGGGTRGLPVFLD